MTTFETIAMWIGLVALALGFFYVTFFVARMIVEGLDEYVGPLLKNALYFKSVRRTARVIEYATDRANNLKGDQFKTVSRVLCVLKDFDAKGSADQMLRDLTYQINKEFEKDDDQALKGGE